MTAFGRAGSWPVPDSPLPPAVAGLLEHASTDPHARSALRAYAISVSSSDRPLANQIRRLVDEAGGR